MSNIPVIVIQLIHIEGPLKGKIQEFSNPEISIGRHPSCQVQFPKDLKIVSRKHARIIREGNRFKLINYSQNGTFLNGLMHVGQTHIPGGRSAEESVTGLTEQLASLGFTYDRMKTGTPVRIDGRSIDFSKLEEQKGDESIIPFSFLNEYNNLFNKSEINAAFNKDIDRLRLSNKIDELRAIYYSLIYSDGENAKERFKELFGKEFEGIESDIKKINDKAQFFID